MGPDGSRTRVDHATWSDPSARAVLQLMVESLAELVGFEVATLSVVLGDELVTVARVGPEEHRAHLGGSAPVSVIAPILERAVPWGPRLRLLDGAALAVLSGDDGAVIGLLSVGRPAAGRLPDERQRGVLERYAAQAERAVLTAFERDALARQVAHAEYARRLVRSAACPTEGSLEDVLRDTHGPLVRGFAACGSWLQVFAGEGPGVGVVRTEAGELVPVARSLVEETARVAPELWARQRPVMITADSIPAGAPEIREHLLRRHVSSVLGIALGVGDECVGFMALSRDLDQPPWSPVEVESALQIGHDLGAALMTARALERERTLVRELQQIADHRSHLIATLSHELRTPLTVISGNLELLGTLDLEPRAARYQQAMGRGTRRMGKVVDDLLLLARVSNPQYPLESAPVELRSITRDVVSLMESAARSKGLAVTVDLQPDPLLVCGDPVELDRVVGNLVGNAVKYTPPGGSVTVSAARCDDEVVLVVADTGPGISEDDQDGLFRAFFRTTNPDALREPGTGLGLAIVASILERHQGRVAVDSRLGEGTTFIVALPAA